MDVNTYRVRSLWQARVETPAAIAARFKTFLALSRAALPPDRRWYTQDCHCYYRYGRRHYC